MSFLSNVKKKKKERKEEVSYSLLFPLLGWCTHNELFFLFDDWRSKTVHSMSKLQTTLERYDGAMDVKRKLYLQIILLLNYIIEQNLFVYVECSSVKHAALRFSVRKMSHTK